jgi:hypothetical protein
MCFLSYLCAVSDDSRVIWQVSFNNVNKMDIIKYNAMLFAKKIKQMGEKKLMKQRQFVAALEIDAPPYA